MQAEISDEQLRALLSSEVPMLGNFLVGFALPRAEGETLDALPGGSGTLVSIDGIEGVLTAKHVLSSLDRNKIAGLVLPSPGPPKLHHISFRMEHTSRLTLPTMGEPTSSGPDLALLIPPPDVLSTLRAKKSFYNLAKRRTKMLEAPSPLDHGIWALSGFSGEWTSDSVPERGFQRIKIFRGGFGVGNVTRAFEDGEFDYLLFEVLYNELYEGPQSFGGFSGGGLWQLLGREENGAFCVTQRLLSGVAFYESDLKHGGDGITREITCQGRRTLYGVFLEQVRRETFHT